MIDPEFFSVCRIVPSKYGNVLCQACDGGIRNVTTYQFLRSHFSGTRFAKKKHNQYSRHSGQPDKS